MSTTFAPDASTVDGLEIILTRTAYDAAVRRQLREPDSYSIGPFRWQETVAGRRILIEELESVRGVPRGVSRPPLDSYLVLRVESDRNDGTAADLLRQVAPLRSHQVAALVLQVGPPARWDAMLQSPGGSEQPVAAVSVQGPAPLHLVRDDRVESLADDERQRWSRTAGALGDETFERVRRARVNVIGAGRNGSLCAAMLGSLGVAQLRLIDGDELEPHNLIGTLGLDTEDLGHSKAESLARSLHRTRPELPLFSRNKSILDADVRADLRRRPTELFVTCVDDESARLAVWLLARSLLVPHLDVASAILPGEPDRQLLGDARLFVPGAGQGCPACVGGVASLDDTLYALNAPPGALRRGEPTTWNAERAGSLVSLNAIVVGAALELWLDYLSGRCRSSAWQRLCWRSGEGLRSEFAAVESTDACRLCGNRQVP